MEDKKQVKPIWKLLAIIFMILFILETAYTVFSIYVYVHETDLMNECYYNKCESYPEAYYENGVCYCYDYSLLGDLVVDKTYYLK